MTEYRCPYCDAWLTDDDVSEDGEALYCSVCGQWVEFFDAMEEADMVLEVAVTDADDG